MLKTPRKVLKRRAATQVESLIGEALGKMAGEPSSAQDMAKRVRRICMKYNLRLPYSKRSLFCHGCKRMIVPGVNARVRIGHRPKAIKITCFECGFTYRKILHERRDK